jgi:tetratricopeptide (TPR) repeat protein
VRNLINERELDADNLDTVYGELTELVEADPQCAWAYGLLSEIYFWFGQNAAEDDKLFCYEQGVNFGEQGIAADEDCLEANMWLSVNYGFFGQEKGVMKSLALIAPIKKLAERAAELDESYFYGGPWRVLGRLYQFAPGFPISIGNKKKALECLEKALKLGPKFYLNHLFLAELYISNREKSKAKERLQWILDAPLSKNHEREDEGYKRDAEKLLKDL